MTTTSTLRADLAALDIDIAATDWVVTTDAQQRNGEGRTAAEKRRAQLYERRRPLARELQAAEQEEREQASRLAEQRDNAARNQWHKAQRADLLASCQVADNAQEEAAAAVRAAEARLGEQLARLSECAAADAAVAQAHAALVAAQGRAWITRSAATEAEERQAVEAYAEAQALASRASAARPHIEDEVTLARDALAVAEHGAEHARTDAQRHRITLQRFDINQAVKELAHRVDALAAVDRGEASRLRSALRGGLVTFNHRGHLEPPAWLQQYLRN